MQNRVQSKVSGISHFFLAVGILILSLFAMTGVAMIIVQKVYGMSLDSLSTFSLADATLTETMALKVAQFIIALSFVIAGFVCAKTFRQNFASFTNIKTRIHPLHLIIGIALLVCLIPIVDGLVRFNASWSFPENMAQSFTELEEKSNHTYALFLKFNTGSQFIINLLVMSVLAAAGEEIFFRGILLRVLSKWFGNIHVGILTSALIFTLVHFQPYKILPMLTLGIFLGYVYYRTKSIWVPICIHAINNAIVVVGDWAEQTGKSLPIFSAEFQFTELQIILSILAFVGIGFLFWKKTKDNDFSYE
jgi:membrane protease YdiL (CAAX protease family)